MRSRHESNTHTRRHQQRCFIPAFISFLISSDYLLLTPKFRTIFGTTVRVFIGTHLLAISLHSAPPNTKPLFRNCNRPERPILRRLRQVQAAIVLHHAHERITIARRKNLCTKGKSASQLTPFECVSFANCIAFACAHFYHALDMNLKRFEP